MLVHSSCVAPSQLILRISSTLKATASELATILPHQHQPLSMKAPNPLSYLTFLFLPLPFLATGQDTATSNSSLTSNNNNLGSSQVECNARHTFGTNFPLVDCAKAILTLPSISEVNNFHSNGGPPAFRLPVTQMVDKCSVIIELANGRGDRGSWTEVRTSATLLLLACSGYGTNPDKPGGLTSAGDGGGIKVTVGEKGKGNGFPMQANTSAEYGGSGGLEIA